MSELFSDQQNYQRPLTPGWSLNPKHRLYLDKNTSTCLIHADQTIKMLTKVDALLFNDTPERYGKQVVSRLVEMRNKESLKQMAVEL
jgi:hypothetical protein